MTILNLMKHSTRQYRHPESHPTNQRPVINSNTFALFPEGGFYTVRPASGECQVLCFDPRSDVTLARMSLEELERGLDAQIELYSKLAQKWTWVQVSSHYNTLFYYFTCALRTLLVNARFNYKFPI